MTKDTNAYKTEARRLHKHLAALYPDFAYSQALEATAALHGAANWRTLVGQEVTDPAAPAGMAPNTPTWSDDDGYRYLIAESWGHLFGVGDHESTVRFVFDRAANRIVHMDIEGSMGRWFAALPDQVADVEDSLKTANDDALENPEAWDIEEENELPAWATEVEFAPLSWQEVKDKVKGQDYLYEQVAFALQADDGHSVSGNHQPNGYVVSVDGKPVGGFLRYEPFRFSWHFVKGFDWSAYSENIEDPCILAEAQILSMLEDGSTTA